MEQLAALLDRLPDEAKDLRLNAQKILGGESLPEDLTWGTALAAALFARQRDLAAAVAGDASARAGDGILADARAAAALMGMNTMYYRFRHLMESDQYNARPANLRMMRMKQPATSAANFELFSLACAALAGCQLCLKAHEKAVLAAGMTHDNVHDAVRIAAVIHGIAVALDMPKV